ATVSYIETHGTGTSLGDPIEINGLKKAFEELYRKRGKTPPPKPHCGLGSVKTNIGHLETAAGIAGVIKVILAMRHKTLPATVHFEELNPYIQLEGSPFYIVKETRPWEPLKGDDGWIIPRRAGVSSFGFGGANAHIVLEEYEEPGQEHKEPGLQLSQPAQDQQRADLMNQPAHDGQQNEQIVVLSARSKERLRAYAQQMVEFLGRATDTVSLTDLAYTLQVGREAMEERLAVVVSGIRELREKLVQYCQGEEEIENIYKGHGANNPQADLLFTGRAGEEFIRIVIQDRNLDQLARLWTLGIKIDWRLLYPTQTTNRFPRRLPLPTYPFARQRYWISKTSQVPVEDKRSIHPIHPLVDKIVPHLSLERGLVFQKTFRPADLIVRDHRIKGQSILPGVGYLEMARASASYIKGSHACILSQCTWLSPLVVQGNDNGNDNDNGNAMDVQIIIRQTGDLVNNHFTYEIQSSQGTSATTHAKGEFRMGQVDQMDQLDQVDQWLSLEEVKARCTYQIDKETLYAGFKETGIAYGPYFQGVERIWVNSEEVLGALSLPSEYQDELRLYTLHPTLMDGALQTIAGFWAASRSKGRQLMMPFAVEEVEILHPLKSQAYAYVKAAGDHTGSNSQDINPGDCQGNHLGNRRFHIAILDEAGLVCIKLHGVALREVKDQLQQFFYRPRWVPDPSPSLSTEEIPADEGMPDESTILIIYPPQGLSLAKALARAHTKDKVVEIELGSESEARQPSPAAADCDFDNCLHQLKNVHTLYFLGGIQTQEPGIDNLEALERSQEQGVLAFFRLIKSLEKHDLTRHPLRIKVITSDVCQVGSEEVIQPAGASLQGLVKSMAKEYPALEISCIDISLREIEIETGTETEAGASTRRPENTRRLENIVAAILKEPANKRGEVVAIRKVRRYIQIIEPVFLSPENHIPFKHQGVYLILGGAGGIGLEFSRYLAEAVQARLVLLGRRELNETQKEKIAHIESKGGQILYIQADATDLESMRAAIERAKSRFGHINGVIHSALVLKDQKLKTMDEETLRAALEPKVKGSVILHTVTQEEPLDFMLFFSSVQSFIGNAGQSNYAAACAFKDAFALRLRQIKPYPVKIINWGYWGSVGVVSGEGYNQRLKTLGIQSIEPEEGMEAIQRVLGHRLDQIIAVKAEDHILKGLGIDLSHQLELYPEHIPSLIDTMEDQTEFVTEFLSEEAIAGI
ncbi:MAG: SDR family NAD(P)-dependent oxidoreductase, partial [bacterium]